MNTAQNILVLLIGSQAVIAAPRQTKSFISREVCQFQVDRFGGEHEVQCSKGDACVDFPLVPPASGIVALVTRKMLRKDVWQNGRNIESSKTKLGICKRIRYQQLPRSGKFVPNKLQSVGENEVEDEIIFPMGHNTICKDVNFNSEGYLVKDPNDCTKFYSCQRTFNGAYKTTVNSEEWVWLAYHMVCPLGTVFDGERCQVGFICPQTKENLERQIQEEAKEIEEEKQTALLEKDFEVVDFTERPVIIVDTSDIENEFDVTDNEQKAENNQRIISTKTTSTIIKDIPNNEFAETENTIPVESHSVRTTETIVKKIPTKTTSAITNELPDDLHAMTIKESEPVETVTNTIRTESTINDINEEEIQIANENEMEVSRIDSTSQPIEVISVTEGTSTIRQVEISSDDVKRTSVVPAHIFHETVETTSSTDETFNNVEVTTAVDVVTIAVPAENTKTLTSNVVIDTAFLPDETLNDETTLVPVDAALLPIETTTENVETVTIDEMSAEISFENEILPIETKSNEVEARTLNDEKTKYEDKITIDEVQTMDMNYETTENYIHASDDSKVVENEGINASVEATTKAEMHPTGKTTTFHKITTTDGFETTVSPLFTTDSFLETTRNDGDVTNINEDSLSVNDQATLVSVDVELLPIETKHEIDVNETENIKVDNTITNSEVLGSSTLSPAWPMSNNVEDMNDETTVASVDTTVSFAETTDDSAETINNEAGATAVNDETTSGTVDSIVLSAGTIINNADDSIGSIPGDSLHLFDGIKNNEVEATTAEVEIHLFDQSTSSDFDVPTILTSSSNDETFTSSNNSVTVTSLETTKLLTDVMKTEETNSVEATTTIEKEENAVFAVEASTMKADIETTPYLSEEPIFSLEGGMEITATSKLEESKFVPVTAKIDEEAPLEVDTLIPIEVSTGMEDMKTTTAAVDYEKTTYVPVDPTTELTETKTTIIPEIEETTLVPVIATTVKKDIETTTPINVKETKFIPFEEATTMNKSGSTEVVEAEVTTFAPVKTTSTENEIETTTTVEIDQTTLAPASRKEELTTVKTTIKEDIEGTTLLTTDDTTFSSVEATSAKEEMKTTVAAETDTTTLSPVEIETIKEELETKAPIIIEDITVLPVEATTEKQKTETTIELEENTIVPVETTVLPDETTTTQMTDYMKKDNETRPQSTHFEKVENNTITHLNENEIFAQFFNEEGSGSEEDEGEIEAEEINTREPRTMDDPVLKFVTYRTETSISKVERV